MYGIARMQNIALRKYFLIKFKVLTTAFYIYEEVRGKKKVYLYKSMQSIEFNLIIIVISVWQKT